MIIHPMTSRRRLKILYVITKSNWGGAQRYVFDLATNLSKDRFECVVASGGSGLLSERLRANGIRVITIAKLGRDVSLFHDLSVCRELISVFRTERPDVIHLNSSKIGGIGAVAARIASLTTGHRPLIVFTAHGWAFSESRPMWQRILICGVIWIASLFQNIIITINTADTRKAKRFPYPLPKRVHQIPLGLRAELYLPKTEARQELARHSQTALDLESPLIGTIAELTPNKDPESLVAAMLRLRGRPEAQGTRCIMIGDGELRSKVEWYIREHKLRETITLTGFVPDASRLLSAFDIFVLSSVKEGLPYSIMEAMSAGLAVVATSVGGVPDLIRDGETGVLVPPRNHVLLSDAILDLLRDPEKRRVLGRNAATEMKHHFSLERMIEETIRCYTVQPHV